MSVLVRSPIDVRRPILTALLCGLLICLTVSEQANPFRLVLKSLTPRPQNADALADDDEEDAEGKLNPFKALVRRVRRLSSLRPASHLVPHALHLSCNLNPATSSSSATPHKRAGVGIPLRC